MTQYYVVCNHDKNERIMTTSFSGSGDGASLMSMLQNGMTGRMLILLLTNTLNIELGKDDVIAGKLKLYENRVLPYVGRWCGDKVEIIGDYNTNYLGLWPFKHYRDITKDLKIAMYSLKIDAFVQWSIEKHLMDAEQVKDEFLH